MRISLDTDPKAGRAFIQRVEKVGLLLLARTILAGKWSHNQAYYEAFQLKKKAEKCKAKDTAHFWNCVCGWIVADQLSK